MCISHYGNREIVTLPSPYHKFELHTLVCVMPKKHPVKFTKEDNSMITFLKENEQHQHPNGGGWVANTAWVSESAYVGSSTQVFGNARVSGNAWVSGNARVFGDARVSDHAQVSGNAWVFGNARVYDYARVSGNAWVSGDARVSGSAWETSPLYIQGSKHGLTNSAYGYLNIGCIKLPFSEWKKRYKEIGKEQNYTPAQIKEYGKLIALATTLGRNKTYGKA
jgi:hypothetical protein